MDLRNKNKRLCELLRNRNEHTSCCSQKKVAPTKRKKSSAKPKTKKCPQNTISMIKFYESIPNYEDVRHLPEYDFTERLRLLKKVHCDLSQPLVKHCDASRSAKSCSRKSSAKCKRVRSACKSNIVSPSSCKNVVSPRLCKDVVSPSLCKSFSKTSLNDAEEFTSAKRNPMEKFERQPSADSISISTPLKRLQMLREKLSHFNDHEFKDDKPKLSTALFSPMFSEVKSDHSLHFHHSHPCELYFNHCPSLLELEQPLSPPYREQTRQIYHETPTSLNSGECRSTTPLRHRNRSKSATKSKSTTPTSMDEYLSSKIVRGNVAATLRHKWSRKKINNMAEEKLKETMTVSNFIPKCHQWNIRNTAAWKAFTSEDTQREKRLREEARREEEKLRHHAHTMNMNIMRARVKTANLLLEGRSLSAKD